jgi:hypothetical protein
MFRVPLPGAPSAGASSPAYAGCGVSGYPPIGRPERIRPFILILYRSFSGPSPRGSTDDGQINIIDIHPAFHWDYWTRAGYHDREFVLRRGSLGNKYDRMKISPMIRGDINILGGDPQSMIAFK